MTTEQTMTIHYVKSFDWNQLKRAKDTEDAPVALIVHKKSARVKKKWYDV